MRRNKLRAAEEMSKLVKLVQIMVTSRSLFECTSKARSAPEHIYATLREIKPDD